MWRQTSSLSLRSPLRSWSCLEGPGSMLRWYTRGGKDKQHERQLQEKIRKTEKNSERMTKEEEYQEVMYSRRHKERIDSLSPEMLDDRLNHKKRYENLPKPTELTREISRLGHGKKSRTNNIYETLRPTEDSWMSRTAPRTATGAGGLATLVGTATKSWPLFQHMLPEIAFAGHSNSGKSTLVNAMIGRSPRGGLAGVSARAGWTDQIHFYQLGKKPPLLTLVDLPGYGHAVASPKVIKAWKDMTHSYMKQRLVLSRVYVLVDCMRGLCEADKGTLTYLEKNNIDWKVILTKCDHLAAEDVAKSALVVYDDILLLKNQLNPSVAADPPTPIEKNQKIVTPRDTDADSNSDSSSSGSESDSEISEMQGEISLKELIKNGYNLPSKIGKRVSNSFGKRDDEKIEDGRDRAESTSETHQTFEDEDQFHQMTHFHSNASKSPQSPGKTRTPLVITDDGEILGGYDIDYNNISSKNYSLLMRSAQQQLLKMKAIRDKELAEKGSVDYELIEIEDDELDLDSEVEEDDDSAGEMATFKDHDITLKEMTRYVLPVSATSGAGVPEMWEDIRQCVITNVLHPPGWEEKEELSVERKKELMRMVREHRLANHERRRMAEAKNRGEGSGGKRERRGQM